MLNWERQPSVVDGEVSDCLRLWISQCIKQWYGPDCSCSRIYSCYSVDVWWLKRRAWMGLDRQSSYHHTLLYKGRVPARPKVFLGTTDNIYESWALMLSDFISCIYVQTSHSTEWAVLVLSSACAKQTADWSKKLVSSGYNTMLFSWLANVPSNGYSC